MNSMTLNWADFTIIGIIFFSIIISLIRGFVREALSLISWAVAIWIALSYSTPFAALLSNYISSDMIRMGVAFFSLFAISLILGTLISYLVAQVIQKTGLSGTDRMLGLIFGLGRGSLVVALMLLVAGLTEVPHSDWWQASVLIPNFTPLVLWLEGLLPEQLPINFA